MLQAGKFFPLASALPLAVLPLHAAAAEAQAANMIAEPRAMIDASARQGRGRPPKPAQ